LKQFFTRDRGIANIQIKFATRFEPGDYPGRELASDENFMNQTLGTPGTCSLVPVAFAEAAVIALHRRLDHAHRIFGGTLESILAEAD
jgi:hypothetical protein